VKCVLGSLAVHLGKLAPLLSRVGTLLLLALLLAVASRAAASGHAPEPGFCLYAARLAGWTTLVIALPCLLLFGVERTLPRGCSMATLLMIALELPFLRPIAVLLASGDGLRARGISAALVEWVVLALLTALSVAVWTYRYWARRRALDLALGLLLGGGLLTCAALLSRAQLQLAAVLQVHALVLGVSLLHLALSNWPRVIRGVALLGVACGFALWCLGWLLPQQLARGTRHALLTEAPLSLVARRLVPAQVEAPLPARTPARCAEVLRPSVLPEWTEPEERRRNVILISIDTVRADYVLRPRPDGTPLMPELARFMQESRRAARAHAAFPATLLSLSAAFSGAMPTDLLLAGRRAPTLAEQVHAHFDSVLAVLPKGNYFGRPDVQAFLLPGLETHEVGRARRENGYALSRLRYLRSRGKRLFMWVHYFEPHAPYVKHSGFDFGDSDEQRYRGELAHVDQRLGELLQLLREDGWFEDSLIAVFADHGESFGEHHHRQHHHLVYPWLVSVPFALHAPGLAPGVFAGPVHTMDLVPTVLQFLGAPARRPLLGWPLLTSDPPPDRVLASEEIAMTGGQLLPYHTQPATSEADVLARLQRIEWGGGYASKLAVAQNGLMLVQQRASRAVELYDMQRDPRAEHDLTEVLPEQARALEAAALRVRNQSLLRALCEVAERDPSR
jgi:hypothetical protein